MTIFRRRLFYGTGKPEPIEMRDAVAGDICLYDKVEQKKILIKKGTLKANVYPSYRYTPIGVVVVPEIPAYYGDWACGILGLKLLSYDYPDTGVVDLKEPSTVMFDFGDTINEFNDNILRDKFAYIGYQNGEDYGGDLKITNEQIGVVNISDEGMFTKYDTFIATDANYGGLNPGPYYASNPYDNLSKYSIGLGDNPISRDRKNYYAPSPYASIYNDNLRIAEGRISFRNNPISDPDSAPLINQIILKYATSQPGWKTDAKIIDTYGPGYCPLYCCAWRYHTDGTSQGEWLIPTAGEWALIISRVCVIDETINEIKSVYGDDVACTVQLPAVTYKTSTPATTNMVWTCAPQGNIVVTDSNTSISRPILRLNDPNPPSIE